MCFRVYVCTYDCAYVCLFVCLFTAVCFQSTESGNLTFSPSPAFISIAVYCFVSIMQL